MVVARLHTNGVLNATGFAAQSSVISNKINALRLDRKKVLAEDEDDELIYTFWKVKPGSAYGPPAGTVSGRPVGCGGLVSVGPQ